MRAELLSEIVKPAGTRAGANSKYKVYSVTKNNGFVPSDEYFSKQVYSRDLSGYKRVEPGDFAYATIHLDEGSVGIAPDDGLISPMYTVFRADSELVDPSYLLRYLKSPPALAQYGRLGRGSVHRRRSISLDALGKLFVPLPTLDEQMQITAILDRAEASVFARHLTINHLSQLRRAMLSEFSADSQAPMRELGDVAVFFGGGSLPQGFPFEGQAGGALLMRVSDMNTEGNEENIVSASEWSPSPGGRSSTVNAGAVLLPKRGASIATNKKRLSARVTTLDPNLMGVAPVAGVLDSTYLLEWFNSFDLRGITSGSSVPQLNKQDLAPLLIPVPRLDEQHRFALQVARVAKLQQVSRRALALQKELFSSLQHRAFRGEL